MRILVLGANLAGLLSALHLRHQGHAVTVLVDGPEVTDQPLPPLVFSDPGPWGAAHGALSALNALLQDCRDLRLGLDGLAYAGWLLRCVGGRWGGRARSQALQALAMARRSQLMFEQLQAGGTLPHALEPVSMLSLYRDEPLAHSQCQRGPMWHLGTRPSLCSQAALQAALAQGDPAEAQGLHGLQSQGWMLADSAGALAALRQQLIQAGVRFIFDHHIDGAAHAGQHLHAVQVRGRLGLAEELDTDLVVAASTPLAQPLLRLLGIKPKLAPLTQWSLNAQLTEAREGAQWVHEHHSGLRLTRQGAQLWAQGPAWLGQPDGSPNQEITHLSSALTRHFGADWTASRQDPLVQTHWAAPDGLPLVSRTRTRNLLLNLGHHSAQPCFAFGALALLQSLLQAGRPAPHQQAAQARWSPSQQPLTSSQGLSHD